MSVRVALLNRSARGGLLHSLRLVGATSDVTWQPPGIKSDSEQREQHYQHAAEWTRTQLDGARTRDTLELLVLDPTGWVALAAATAAVTASSGLAKIFCFTGVAARTDWPSVRARTIIVQNTTRKLSGRFFRFAQRL